ncbi:MAG: hypothetical protein ACI9OH_003191 [Oleispira sp.]|jgi:hypothetical protein
MFQTHKIVNSKNKKNIRFVAAGSFQIEFFTLNDQEYFSIYQPESASCILIELKKSEVSVIDTNNFKILLGLSIYKIKIASKNDMAKVFVSRFLWGWLPLSRFGGKISSSGISTIRSNLELFTKELAL